MLIEPSARPHQPLWVCAQSCLTLCNPTDYSLPVFTVHSPGKNTGVGFPALLQRISPNQGLNPHLLCFLHLQKDALTLSHLGKCCRSISIYTSVSDIYLVQRESALPTQPHSHIPHKGSVLVYNYYVEILFNRPSQSPNVHKQNQRAGV